jgi:GT2 family glycosyltransferase
MSRVAVVVCCHNRKSTTLGGLTSLFRQRQADDLAADVYLVDDGSSDGTAEAVAAQFPTVKILHGDGTLWWVGAMRLGWAAAMAVGYDGYILWNDDTALMEDAVFRLVSCARAVAATLGPAIVTGSTLDRVTGGHSFGGWRRVTLGLRVKFVPVPPEKERPIRCDTMNGNFTLIPAAIVEKLGNLEAGFLHRLADWDYGLRAGRAGFPIIVAPGYFGYCTPDSEAKTWRDGSMPLAARWKHLMSPRGMDPREWLLYTSRHLGWRFPLYFVSPYVKVLWKGWARGRVGPV